MQRNDIDQDCEALANAIDSNDNDASKTAVVSLAKGLLHDVRRIADALTASANIQAHVAGLEIVDGGLKS